MYTRFKFYKSSPALTESLLSYFMRFSMQHNYIHLIIYLLCSGQYLWQFLVKKLNFSQDVKIQILYLLFYFSSVVRLSNDDHSQNIFVSGNTHSHPRLCMMPSMVNGEHTEHSINLLYNKFMLSTKSFNSIKLN